MMTLCLLFFSMSLALGFIGSTHPLALGMLLLIQTLVISLLVGLSVNSFWLSYVLYLVFLGGMLVLFLYTTSLASNEIFKFNFSFGLTCLGLSFTCCFGLYEKMPFSLMFMFSTSSSESSLTPLSIFENLTPLYSFPTFSLTMFMAWYLLVSLLVVAKIINVHAGPLRSSS